MICGDKQLNRTEMEKYDEFWLKLQTKAPQSNIAKVRKLTEGVAQTIENVSKKDGIRTDELLLGLSIGVVASFEVLSPKNRKKMVEELCCFLHDASESMETGKKEDNNN